MHIGIVLGRLRNRIGKLVRCERGNIMATFGLALIPIVAVIGAAVDYSRGNSARTAMQSAVDATALILSKEAQKLTTSQLNTKADQIFRAQFHRPDVTNIAVTPAFVDSGTGNFTLTLAASGIVPTTFTRVVGQEQMNISASNEVVWGIKKLELALALDTTGSMASNNKLTELKKAAKSLITTLKGVAKKDGDVKIAIVPFAVDVNVGTNYVNAAWLDWSHWADEPAVMAAWIAANQTTWSRTGPGSSCPFTNGNHGFRCSSGLASKANDSTISTIPSSGGNTGLLCPSKDNGSKSTTATGLLTNSYHNGCYTSTEKPAADWYTVASGSSASCGSNPNCSCSGSGSSRVCMQKTYTHDWRRAEKSTWNGCVRDRNQDYDTQAAPLSYVATTDMRTNMTNASENYPRAATPATSDAFQPHQFYDCGASLMPLSFDWTALNDKIDSLQAVGNTNVTIGLDWGFNILTSGGPLGGAAPPSGELDKVIILLTDGDNTQNRWTTSGTDIDARTQLACATVKKANIKLYTIRVIDGNASLLQGCASQTDMYYNVQNASQLNDVFAQIAKNLANLRIAK